VKTREMRAISGPRITTQQGIHVLLTKGATGPSDEIQMDCSWEHRGRRDTGNENSEGVNLFGTEAADSAFPRSRECSDHLDLIFY
jgi:hypothetical protein